MARVDNNTLLLKQQTAKDGKVGYKLLTLSIDGTQKVVYTEASSQVLLDLLGH